MRINIHHSTCIFKGNVFNTHPIIPHALFTFLSQTENEVVCVKRI